jgi:hypothetical protein
MLNSNHCSNHCQSPNSPILLFFSLYILGAMFTHDSGTISVGGVAFGAVLLIVSILLMIVEFRDEERQYARSSEEPEL